MFSKKFQEADLHIKQTEPYSPWQLQAEGDIRDLNKGAGSMMVQAGEPKWIWYDSLDFKSYVRSNTALDIYILKGEFPYTVILGGTSDISKL